MRHKVMLEDFFLLHSSHFKISSNLLSLSLFHIYVNFITFLCESLYCKMSTLIYLTVGCASTFLIIIIPEVLYHSHKKIFSSFFLRRLFFLSIIENIFFISTKYLPSFHSWEQENIWRDFFLMHTKEREGNENLQKIKSPLGMCLRLMPRWQCRNSSSNLYKSSMIMYEFLSRFISKVGWDLLRILKPQISLKYSHWRQWWWNFIEITFVECWFFCAVFKLF